MQITFFRSSEGTAVMPLFQHNQDFSTLCISLSVPVDIQKKAEGILETLWTELDQQEDIEVV